MSLVLNTAPLAEIAAHEQDARIRDTLHRRALMHYRRTHAPVRPGRTGLAETLRRIAARLDGSSDAPQVPAQRTATVTRLSPR